MLIFTFLWQLLNNKNTHTDKKKKNPNQQVNVSFMFISIINTGCCISIACWIKQDCSQKQSLKGAKAKAILEAVGRS